MRKQCHRVINPGSAGADDTDRGRPSDRGATVSLEDPLELLASVALGDGGVTEVIRPAAIIPELSARQILVELALRDARRGGVWDAHVGSWRRYDQPWDGADGEPGQAQLIGNLQAAYGTPTRYDITIYRATVTPYGAEHGWTVSHLCDEALAYGGLSLASCPRATLAAPPKAFRLPAAPSRYV
jgi:hypothetical protein